MPQLDAGGCLEFFRHEAHDLFDPDIPGNVTAQLAGRDPKVAEALGDAPPGMVAAATSKSRR